jgi:hypothetical protein
MPACLSGRAVGSALLAGVLTCALASCVVSIDEEPGFDAELNSAAIRVLSSADGESVVEVDIEMRVRVGDYALSARDFDVPRADLSVDDSVVATVNLEGFEGGEMDLLPGESNELSLRGATRPGGFPEAAALLCQASVVTVEVQYVAAPRGSDEPLGMPIAEMGTLGVETNSVLCD